MADRLPHTMAEHMSDRVPEYLSDRISEYMLDKLSENIEYIIIHVQIYILKCHGGITRSKVFFCLPNVQVLLIERQVQSKGRDIFLPF